MKKFMVFLLVFVVVGCSTGETQSDNIGNIECAITSPTLDSFVSGEVEVTLSFSGPATNFELLMDETVVAELEDLQAEGEVTLSWNTTESTDGLVELKARAFANDNGSLSEPISVVVDGDFRIRCMSEFD